MRASVLSINWCNFYAVRKHGKFMLKSPTNYDVLLRIYYTYLHECFSLFAESAVCCHENYIHFAILFVCWEFYENFRLREQHIFLFAYFYRFNQSTMVSYVECKTSSFHLLFILLSDKMMRTKVIEHTNCHFHFIARPHRPKFNHCWSALDIFVAMMCWIHVSVHA